MTLPDYFANNPRAVKAWPAFDAVTPYMHLREWGYGVRAADRVRRATSALREFRHATNQSNRPDEELAIAVRLGAETFADQIAEHGYEYDDRTIRWVLAGLRCSSQPFCTGCPSCQTVTSPERVKVSD